MRPLQSKTSTSINRYPALLRPLIRWAQKQEGPLNILSFGCSDGSEIAVMALLLPQARFLGVDVNEAALAKARELYRAIPNVEFAASTWPVIAQGGPFDVILANSVLCRHPDALELSDLTELMSFSWFQDAAARLAEALAPGGLLVVSNSNYSITDAVPLEPVATSAEPFNGFAPKFDRDGRKIIQTNGKSDGTLFWARPDVEDPWPLVRYSAFAKGNAEEYRRIYALPSYEFADEATIAPTERAYASADGFRAMPYRTVLRRVLTGGRLSALRQLWAEENLLGEMLIS